MCGIAGIFDLTGHRPLDAAMLRAMNDIQVHRGPDDSGVHLEPGTGLAHRRLSIIDLSSGHQPLHNEDGSVAIVFNGEIYNFQELRATLEAAGHTFRTRSDTEVIVHAWEEWGRRCVERFRGMFAFALWDRNRETLFLARDRLGVKPLFYARLPGDLLVFASELKGLMQHPALPRAVDPKAVAEYFSLGYVADPRCILAAVRKLPAGFTLEVVRGRPLPEPQQYWDLHFDPQPGMTEAGAIESLLERLEESVRIRMVADVPVGAFLSGGVDSSGVVAMMVRSATGPVNTCSISFGDPRFNESAYAEKVARTLATHHTVAQVDPDDFSLLDRLALIYDEPFADSSALPTYRVCELARREVKVALSGDGGDETFAGYRRYRWHMFEERIRRLLPAALRRSVFGTLARIYPKADWAPRVFRAKTTLDAIARDSADAYFNSVSISTGLMRQRLFSDRLHRDLQGYGAEQLFREITRTARITDPLAAVQYLDVKTYLVGDILTKVDRASMATSLEVREPLLDHHLLEWAATLPASLKLRGGEGKYILKKALARSLPPEILYRPKMGFAVPIGRWFRSELRNHVRERLLNGTLADTEMFQMDSVRQLLDQHQGGAWDHAPVLWSLLIYESFSRQVLAGEPAVALPQVSGA